MSLEMELTRAIEPLNIKSLDVVCGLLSYDQAATLYERLQLRLVEDGASVLTLTEGLPDV